MSLSNDYARTNRIVEKFLHHKVYNDGRTEGHGCAGDILRYCHRNEIVIPCKRPIWWLNIRVVDTINNGAEGFHIEEGEGYGHGINFRWKLHGKKKLMDAGCEHGRDPAGPAVR